MGIPVDKLLPADVQLGPAQCWWLGFPASLRRGQSRLAWLPAGARWLEWLKCESKSSEGSNEALKPFWKA